MSLQASLKETYQPRGSIAELTVLNYFCVCLKRQCNVSSSISSQLFELKHAKGAKHELWLFIALAMLNSFLLL